MGISELEMELGKIQAQTSESAKAYQRAERRGKELQFQQDEDKKNQERRTRRSPPSTWPSSGRRSRSSRRPRRGRRCARSRCPTSGPRGQAPSSKLRENDSWL